jgi:membrane-bound lytic murein transglycosylase B
MLTLGLVACATQPKSPPSSPQASSTPRQPAAKAHGPAEAAPEATAATAPPVDLTPVPFEVARARFIADTAKRYGLKPEQISSVLDQAQVRQPIIAAMSRPAERVKPWNEYRPMFISKARIDGGRAFLAEHRAELDRVQQRTGVPAEVIVAIIGVETSYGKNAGSHRVLDALYTLAFYYPRSGDPAKLEREVRRELFFRDELAKLFELGREEKLDITTLKGSYAGAMGMGQFMPSSYLDYAVDGNGDGRRDLFTSYDDVFSSIANYFVKKGGWVRGGQVAVPATLAPGREEFNPTEWMPTWTMADLAQRGYQPGAPVQPGATATPITLEGSTGKQYWLGFRTTTRSPATTSRRCTRWPCSSCPRPSPDRSCPRHEHQMAGPRLDRPRAGGLQQRAKKPATAGHGGKSGGTLVQGRGSRPAHCPEGSPCGGQGRPGTRGNYTAGGLYKPGVRDSTPDYIPNVACIPEPEVTAEERSAIGNKSPYVVLGKSYKVLDDTRNYVERGTASYYGAKFHGRLTSNREVYDMYQFTAAHKTLPLPSFARVTNLDNGESVIVRVNDRGPFHDGRVVDLSYAAAVRLGITQRGTGNVEVRALQPGESNLLAQKPSRRERRAAEAAAAWPVHARQRPRAPLPTAISIAWSSACRPMACRHAASRPPPRAWPAPRRTWRSAACRRAHRCAAPHRRRLQSPAPRRARCAGTGASPPRRRHPACRSRWSAR